MGSSFREKISKSVFFRFETMVIIVAVLLGVLGSFLQHNITENEKQEIIRKYETIKVLAFSLKLAKGSILKDSDLQVKNILKDNLSPNMLIYKKSHYVKGKSLSMSVLAGDFLTYTMLQNKDDYSSFAMTIPSGKRLFTLNIVENPGPAGKLKSGDHVDIVVKYKFPEKGETFFTLFENVIIRAVGNHVDSQETYREDNISFYVTPEEIERISFAQEKGEFYVYLRNPFDQTTKKDREGFNLDRFLMSKNVYESAQPSVEINVSDKQNE